MALLNEVKQFATQLGRISAAAEILLVARWHCQLWPKGTSKCSLRKTDRQCHVRKPLLVAYPVRPVVQKENVPLIMEVSNNICSLSHENLMVAFIWPQLES